MKEVKVEVIGLGCVRCQAVKEIAEKAAEKLKRTGMSVKVEWVSIFSKEVIRKYGILVSPALAVNGVVKVMGEVPSEGMVERLMREAAE